MAGTSGLYRRSSGIYVVRIAIPRRHRTAIGQNELHVSTGIRDWNRAKLEGLRIQLKWHEHFMSLDKSTLIAAKPLLQGDGLVSIEEAARLLGLSPVSLLTELLNAKSTITSFATEWACWQVDDLYGIAKESDGAFVVNDVESSGTRQIFTGAVRPLDSVSAIGQLIATGSFSADIFRVEKGGGLFCDAPHQISVSAALASKADVEAIRSRLQKDVADTPPATVTPRPTPESVKPTKGQMPFSALFDLYKRSRDWKYEQQKRMTTEAKLFVDLMDDPTLNSIDVETILEYEKRLGLVPTNIYLARRRYKVNTVAELIEIAATQSLGRKSTQTIKRHIGHISEIINFALRNGMMHFNPAADFKRGRGRNSSKRAQDERSVFDAEELKTIFGVDWFIAGKGESKNWRPHYYFLPLIGLLAGARLTEIAQLYLDDIKQSEAGTWFLDFNLTQPDKIEDAHELDANDKTLKTVNSVRVVPMHPVLIQLGLPKYAGVLRNSGEVRLFPELKHDAVKGYGKPAGSWFNDRFLGKRLGIVRNNTKTFHSLRHVFITALERQNLPERVMTQLAGHERGRSQSAQRYAKDRDADELASFIAALQFDCLQDVAPIDIDAALVAIGIAKNRKQQVKRREELKPKQDQ
jgi:integrase